MTELYEVGEVIGTGTFGIIRKVRLVFRLSWLRARRFQHPSSDAVLVAIRKGGSQDGRIGMYTTAYTI